mmetsp:Transcript_52872/g.133573  ORF Transcript_52872/g.133573 Transcript_52872/m.133573 type:complete len:207 (-) Transcript_52872:942-1562(-)
MTKPVVPIPVEKVVKLAAFIPVASIMSTRLQSPPQKLPTSSVILWSLSTSKSPSKPSALRMTVTPVSFLPPVKWRVCLVHRFNVSWTYSNRPQATIRKVTSPMPKRLFWMMFTSVRSELECTDQYFQGSPMPHFSYIGSNIFNTKAPGVGTGPWCTNQHGNLGLAKFFRRVTMYTLFEPFSMQVRAFSTANAPLPRIAQFVSLNFS